MQVAIPKNTENLIFKVSTDKGAQGKQKVVVGNPILTNSLPQTPVYNGQNLMNIGASYYTSNTYYRYAWSDKEVFKLGDTLVNRGFGLQPTYTNYEYGSVEFNISDYDFTTLETTIGLDSKFINGDRGNTSLGIYADGIPIYTKTMTNKTQPEAIKVAIPTGTTWLKFISTHDNGTQGFHRVVVDNPVLTNSFQATPKVNAQMLAELNFSDSSRGSYAPYWSNKNVFTDANGTPVSQSIGLTPYYSSSSEEFATYYVGDYDQNIFDTTFTLDSKWLNGDYGTTKVTVFADNKSIGSVTLNRKNHTATFSKAIPKGTKYLKIQANFAEGTAGSHGLVAIHPTLRSGFTDISVSHSYFNEVNYLTDKNIINGYTDGTFKPSNQLTRGHAAMLISRALNLSPSSSMKFTDVAKDYNGYKEIAAVVNAGLFDDFIKGSKFDQNKLLTRGEMANILVKAFDLEKQSSKTFNDTASYWAKDSITALYDNKITTGYEDNTFRPNQTLTRAHFTVFIARSMNEAFR